MGGGEVAGGGGGGSSRGRSPTAPSSFHTMHLKRMSWGGQTGNPTRGDDKKDSQQQKGGGAR